MQLQKKCTRRKPEKNSSKDTLQEGTVGKILMGKSEGSVEDAPSNSPNLNKPLLSKQTWYVFRTFLPLILMLITVGSELLIDQMGLIKLLDEELPVILALADTFNSHVFNVSPMFINSERLRYISYSILDSKSTTCWESLLG